MGSLTLTHRATDRHRSVLKHIARWTDNVLDLDVVVDDKRAAVHHAISNLYEALAERDRAARHLKHLLEWFDDDAV
jgi:hypothetical protein